MSRGRFTWIVLLAWPLMAPGQVPAPAERRAQIEARRESVEAQHRQALQACAGEFALTACTDQARHDRRREVDRLDAEIAAIDLADRRRRAAERSQRVEEKQQAIAARPAKPPAVRASPVRAASPTVDGASARRAQKSAEDRASAASAAALAASGRERERNRRVADQQAHAEAVRQRNAERARQRPVGAPLPAAPASALR